MRCLLARLPAGACISPHVDRPPYFGQTLRLHFPVTSHERAFMFCAGRCYVMRPGEVWVLNNSTTHGALNADPHLDRTHLICDFVPNPTLLALVATGARDLGERRPEIEAQLNLRDTNPRLGRFEAQ
jgi:hypothetical protein